MGDMETALAQELKEAVRVNRMNAELLEVLGSNMRYLIRYSEKNGIDLAERKKLDRLLARAFQLLGEISPELKHLGESPDYEAEPGVAAIDPYSRSPT